MISKVMLTVFTANEGAKKMYEIAKLGEEEYNHPTRVIGSAGKSAHVTCCLLMLTNS